MERKHKLRSILAVMLTFAMILGGLPSSFVSTVYANNSLTFSRTEKVDGMKVTVEADESVFPEGAALSVEKVGREEQEKAEETIESQRESGQMVAASYTYDVKMLDADGNEIQPEDGKRFKISFTLDEIADENLETNVYHIKESGSDVSVTTGSAITDETGEVTVEKLEVETDGDTATAETDGFSLYTVEFTYNDLQYVLPGDSEVELSQILSTVGLSGEVTEVSVSDSSLFSAAKNDSGEWIVTVHKAFSTDEWMKVTINGVEYEITVTDDTDPTTVTLTSETGEVTLTDGQTLTGEGGTNTHVTIADGATVTLSGVNITSIGSDSSHSWAGITCAGDATIILAEGTTNSVKGGGGTDYRRSGIYIPANKTLTIKGSGSLEATGNSSGIGANGNVGCGNIILEGGHITATGASGSSNGIGGYYNYGCGDITIKKEVIYLEATKSSSSNKNNSIGAGHNGGACGTVSICGFITGSIKDNYIYDSSIQYTVKFDGNGGTGSMDDLSLAFGQQIYLPTCGFTKGGSTFYGWSTTADGYIEYDDEQRILNLSTENGATVTLYPVWSKPIKSLTASTGDITIYDGQTLTGTGGANTHITIADGATVTLSGVNNTSIGSDSSHNWAGITCAGDATIILKENTTNIVKGGYYSSGVFVPENATLTIQGNGSLEATGSTHAAGIGADSNSSCGNITLKGGHITATGAHSGAGIGSASSKSCGNITIEKDVAYIKATGGGDGWNASSIGTGKNGTCGTVLLFGVETGSISGDYIYDSSIHYTVELNGNGGMGSMNGFTLALGEPKKLPKSVFTKSGAIFGGWNTNANGDVLYKDEEIIRDLANTNNATVTLYAIWKDPTETITTETGAITAVDGQILTGTGGADTHIIIADGATVTLSGLDVSSITKDSSHEWAALTCEGDATIILAAGTENTLKGGTGYPCIYVPKNSTLTIQGSGKLVADNSDNDYAAGIGSGNNVNCGNIEILGGDITAKGGSRAAGIGSGNKSSCGNITIVDASITAAGGNYGAGIGSAFLYPNKSTCGTVTIASGSLNITKGTDALNCIGKAYSQESYSVCGTVTLGGIVGEISESPYIKNISNETYTVNFDGNGGTGTMSAQTFNRGLEKSLTRNGFTRSGFAFIGWSETPDGDVKYKDCVKVMNLAEAGGSVTLYAKWYSTEGVPSGLQIDGDYTESDAGFYYVNMPINGATTSININDTKYYKFKIYDNGGKNGDYKVGTHGYLIISVPEGYRVKFSGSAYYNGDLLFYDSNTVDNEKKCGGYFSYHNGFVDNEPKTTGQFVTVSFGTAGATAAKSGLDLTAQVLPVNYKVSFNANADTGFSGTMEDQSFTYDEGAKALTQNGFTREGYIYEGWAASADGAVVYADKAEVSNLSTTEGATIELYAKWKKLLSNSDITVEGVDKSFAYTGNAITPAIVVKDGSTDITDQCDITYSNNTAIGTATVTITAKSNSTGYAGSTTRSFNIVHKHSFTYSANGAVLTATCNGKGTCELTGNKVTFTIAAPTLAVYGGAGSAEATLTGLDEFNTATGLNIAATSIKYVGRGDTTYIENATAPTEAGTYTASITAGGNTASVEYTIAQKEVGLEWSNTSLTYTGSPQKPTATATGVIDGDAGGVSVIVSGEETNAGTGYTATATGLTGAKAGNYKLPSENTHSFSIAKADATLSVGTASFEKAFGDEPFALEGIIATPADAALTYSVTDSKNVAGNTVADNKVITVNAFGTVTIVGAGSATVKIDLPESTNYNAAASKTISVTVSKKAAPTIDAINKTYLYSAGGEDSVTLSALLPADCGAVSYAVATTGDVTYSAEPTVTNGVLSYTVNLGEINKTGTITVTVTTENYADITITVNVKLADQKPVALKDGTSVTLNKSTLTYGEALSTLTFKNTAVFVEQGNTSNVIEGTIAWQTPEAVPVVGTTSAAWKFTPTDSAYATLTGDVAITVNKAESSVTTAPEAKENLTYDGTQQVLVSEGTANGGTMMYCLEKDGTYQASAPTGINAGDYKVWYYVQGDENHSDTTKQSVSVSIAQATPDIGTVTADDLNDTTEASSVVLHRSVETIQGTLELTSTSLKYGTNENYNWKFTPTDTTNYKTITGTVTVNVKDTIAPTGEVSIKENKWSSFLNAITFGWYQLTDEVKITSADSGSGIDKVYYFIHKSETPLTEAEVTAKTEGWEIYGSAFSISQDMKCIIYVKIVDKAGNTTYISSYGLGFDGTAPAISGATDGASYVYGTPVALSVTDAGELASVKINDVTENESGTYTKSISDVGNYTVTATDKAGNASTISFSITKAAITPTVSITGWTYGQMANTPTVEGNSGDGSVTYTYKVKGAADSTYTSTVPADAGEYTVRATIAETTNYHTGTATADFTVSKASSTVASAPQAVSGLKWDGSAKALVTAGSTNDGTMVYSLSASGTFAEQIPTGTDAKDYTVYYKVKGDKNHEDSVAEGPITVNIAKGTDPAVVAGTATVQKGGNTIDLSNCVSGAKGTVTYAITGALEGCSVNDSTGIFTSGSTTGTCTVTVTIAASTNCESRTEEIQVSVVDKLTAGLDVTQEGTVYGGTALKAPSYHISGGTAAPTGGTATITYTGTLRKNGNTYNSATKPTEAGSYSVSVVYENDTTIYSGSASFTITPADIGKAVITLADGSLTYTGNEQTKTVSKVELDSTEISASDYEVAGNKGTNAGNYTITVTAKAASNYTGTATKTFTIAKALPHIQTAPAASQITYGKTLSDSTLTGGTVQKSSADTTAVAGAFTWKAPDTKPAVSDSNTTEYVVVFTPSGADAVNYEGEETKVKLTVAKADHAAVTAAQVEVAAGDGSVTEVNLGTYLESGASLSSSDKQGDLASSISEVALTGNKLTFQVATDVQTGKTGTILLNVSSANYNTYTITVPVIVKAKSTQVVFDEETGTETSVSGVSSSNLSDFTAAQTETAVKVVLDVEVKKAEHVDSTVKTKIESELDKVFSDVESTNIKTEFLDMKVTKSVNGGSAETVDDVGRVLEIEVSYDLTGKYNPVIIREHKGSVARFTELSTKPTGSYKDGTFSVDREKNKIYIYTEFFSTYSIAYADTPSYQVTFDNDGTKTQVVVKSGGKVTKPANPTKSGYTFNGWFGGSTAWNFDNDTVSSDLTLTAKWIQNGGGSGSGGSGNGGGSGSGGNGGGSGGGTSAPTKTTPAKPAAPTLESKTDASITVKTAAGQVYSIDGGKNWQTSGTFTGLAPETEYSIVTKVSETSTSYESAVSDALKVKTDKKADPSTPTAGPGSTTTPTDKPDDTAAPGSTTSPTVQPSDTATPGGTEAPGSTETPDAGKKPAAKGTVLVDAGKTAAYVVTSADAKHPTITYKKCRNKKAKTVTIPKTMKIGGVTYTVTSIAANAFKNHKTLTKVTIGNSIKTIGKNAFYGCRKLKTVTIGKNVTKIGAGAFSGCKKLVAVKMGSKVSVIGAKAFYNCASLKSITIPKTVTKIGKKAFSGCGKLKKITVKTKKLTLKNVGKSAFSGIYIRASVLVPGDKRKEYALLFRKRGAGKKIKIKKS